MKPKKQLTLQFGQAVPRLVVQLESYAMPIEIVQGFQLRADAITSLEVDDGERRVMRHKLMKEICAWIDNRTMDEKRAREHNDAHT